MYIFDNLHIFNIRMDAPLAHLLQFATGVADKGKGFSAIVIRPFNGLNDIDRVAAAGYADHQVAGLHEIFERFDKHIIIANVIGIRHEGGHIVIEADELEAGFAVRHKALVEIADHVGSCRRATAIAHDKNLFACVPRVKKRLDEVRDLTVVKRIECTLERVEIGINKAVVHMLFLRSHVYLSSERMVSTAAARSART